MSALSGCAGSLSTIPDRRADADSGSRFVEQIRSLDPVAREAAISEQITGGNLPPFLRRFVPIQITSHGHTARIYVMPDYLSIGSNEDFVRMPMRPTTAQQIADRFGCCLPTRKMVDDIYAQAGVKLEPSPFDPRKVQMTSVDVFYQSHQRIEQQRAGRPLGLLVAGIKKDVVITPLLSNDARHVAIYGWHRLDGQPIQPLYVKHFVHWIDYSHGIRLVSNRMQVDGKEMTVQHALADPELCMLLSDEGPILSPRYLFPTTQPAAIPPTGAESGR